MRFGVCIHRRSPSMQGMKSHLVVALAVACLAGPACSLRVSGGPDVGAQLQNGTIYLGWNLFSSEKNDREIFEVGAQHGTFTAVYLKTSRPVAIRRVVAVFTDGTNAELAVAPQWAADYQTPLLPFPGTKQIERIDVYGKATTKKLAKVEVYGQR